MTTRTSFLTRTGSLIGWIQRCQKPSITWTNDLTSMTCRTFNYQHQANHRRRSTRTNSWSLVAVTKTMSFQSATFAERTSPFMLGKNHSQNSPPLTKRISSWSNYRVISTQSRNTWRRCESLQSLSGHAGVMNLFTSTARRHISSSRGRSTAKRAISTSSWTCENDQSAWQHL